MYKLLLITIVAAGCFSCSTHTQNGSTVKNSPTNNTDSTINLNTPVETKSANTGYKPAFAGQTRIGSVKTSTPFTGNVITSSLNHPWGIVGLPDGRLLINEKGGTMRIVSSTGKVEEAISGIPAVNSSGQGGLLGIAIDPQFATNKMVYWTFSEAVDSGNLTSVAKGTLSADEKLMENVSVVYRATPAYRGNLHYGSRVVVDQSGNLIISTGERSDIETRPQAQDLNSGLGKIIRITKEGQPAPGNPFINQAGKRPELYSYGHRNVQGLAIHPVTGGLWNSEFGPRGGDEINQVMAGRNYGWPVITYGLEYNGEKVGDAITQQAGMEQPVYYWDPVLSPSGMTFYNSDQIAEWKNNLFVTGLNSNHIARIVIKNNKVVGEERLLANEGQRFRDITQGKDGFLYAITDEGRLYRIGKN